MRTDDVEKILREKAEIIDRCIEKFVPREMTEAYVLSMIRPLRGDLDLVALNETISKPFWEFLDRGGKRWRATLFLMVCEALGVRSDDFLDLAVIPEIIHNGTLIADDIEDSSSFRRGKPCTYKIFGLDVAINLSNFMYFIPLLALREYEKKLSNEKIKKLYEIYVQEMVNLSLGQAIDIAWHRDLTPKFKVSERHYMQTCAFKTGTLARMAAKMAAVIAGVGDEVVEKIGRFAESIGIAFQIQDDLLDLTGQRFAEGKGGLGMDITEGKLSLIMIHTLEVAEDGDRKELEWILRMHTEDEREKRRAISIINKYGSIEYARKVAARIVEESWSMVDGFLPQSPAKEMLKALAHYLIERQV
ncbi:MAG: polyprenyl synthetase family protein [Nitrososphaerota archaeon]|nr:polyprenyl synthetase family protein [Candidatus Bathyarchaeota archaeon]MDW8048789.1 polyprenyl synthetase family protein [Nitrososphaerota archaeon]